MDRQPHVCVIDWFGVSYDGTMPNIVFACDEIWFGLFPVAPPNPSGLGVCRLAGWAAFFLSIKSRKASSLNQKDNYD
jgi:hypothetical protein